MNSPLPRVNAARPGNRVQSDSVASELRAEFERDVVSMRDPLYRRAYHLSRNHLKDAEDLVQETMMKAYAAFPTFLVGTNLMPGCFETDEHVHQRVSQEQAPTRALFHR